MPGRHIIQRGSHYHYVCRVPNDLLQYFPTPVIWKSLKTSDTNHARILATAWEYKTQQLYLQLRSGMLDSHLIDHLVSLYLQAGICTLESNAYSRSHKIGEIETLLDSEYKRDFEIAGNSDVSGLFVELLRERLQAKYTLGFDHYTNKLVDIANKKYNVKLTAHDKKELDLKVMQCEKQLLEADSAIQRGEFSPLQLLKEMSEKTKPYVVLNTVIGKYKEWFSATKPDIKPGSRSDMEVECSVLMEVFGNVSIDTFNTMDSITHLKKVLLKYPKNRIQRFGPASKRSINNILKVEKDYETISSKTANEYIKRAKALVEYAIKADMLDKANKWNNETFSVELAEEDKHQAYDDSDIARLVDALCTQELWHYKPPKPERFWVVLIALFHGFRLSNITGLNKSDICLTNSDIWVFRVRFGKRKSTVKDYPIHDCLLLLGFLEWVEKIDRLRLFQDSSDQISKWWNRVDRDKEGNVKNSGFESSHITNDPTKCLYSLRHHYAGEVYHASQDYKATAEALGHSLSGKVTNGYIGKMRLVAHKELTDKLQFAVDLDKLEARAQELFNVNVPKTPSAPYVTDSTS